MRFQPHPATLLEQGFNLTYLVVSLTLVLALSAARLKTALSAAPQPAAAGGSPAACCSAIHQRCCTKLLVVFKLGSFCSGQGFLGRSTTTAWGSDGAGLEPLVRWRV